MVTEAETGAARQAQERPELPEAARGREEPPGERSPADPVILNFWPPGLWGNEFLLF